MTVAMISPWSAWVGRPVGSTPTAGCCNACRATWADYCKAYVLRYGVKPVRNAKVNDNVKALVKRLGETPDTSFKGRPPVSGGDGRAVTDC